MLGMTPHVTQNRTRAGGSAIDGRTTHHPGYANSQRARSRIEPAFGWLKTIAWLRKIKLRGLANVHWLVCFAAAAFNLSPSAARIHGGTLNLNNFARRKRGVIDRF